MESIYDLNAHLDPIRELLDASEATAQFARRAGDDPEFEPAHAAAAARLRQAVQHLEEIGTPENEIFALIGSDGQRATSVQGASAKSEPA